MMALVFTLILADASFAHTASTVCAGHLSTPPPIGRVFRDVYPVELLDPVVRIYHPGERLPELPPGAYLWLVNKRRELLLTPKYDFDAYARSGRGLATHKGQLRGYLAQKGITTEWEIVAGGQFRIAHGIAVYVSNKSGNYPAGLLHLEFGYAVLTAYGLPVVSGKTRLMEHSGDMGHSLAGRSLEESQLGYEMDVRRSPEALAWRDLFERFGRVLLATAPTMELAVGELMKAGAARDYLGVMELGMLIANSTGPDGLTYAVWLGYFGRDPNEVREAWSEAPGYLETLLEMHPELNQTEVRALIADFHVLTRNTTK